MMSNGPVVTSSRESMEDEHATKPKKHSPRTDNALTVSAFLDKTSRTELKDAKPVVGISVGKRYHSGDQLIAILDMLETSLANECYKGHDVSFLIGGALQRHNFFVFTEKMSDANIVALFRDQVFNTNDYNQIASQFSDLFMHHAMQMEEDFIKCVKLNLELKSYDNLTDRFAMLRWSSCVLGEGQADANDNEKAILEAYQSKYNNIIQYYSLNEEFRNAIDARTAEFLKDKSQCTQLDNQAKRLQKLVPALRDVNFTELFKLLSRNYLVEEIPLFLVLADLGYTHHLYPSKEMPKAFQLAFRSQQSQLKWKHLRFKDLPKADEQLKNLQQIILEKQRELEELAMQAQILQSRNKIETQSDLLKEFDEGEECPFEFECKEAIQVADEKPSQQKQQPQPLKLPAIYAKKNVKHYHSEFHLFAMQNKPPKAFKPERMPQQSAFYHLPSVRMAPRPFSTPPHTSYPSCAVEDLVLQGFFAGSDVKKSAISDQAMMITSSSHTNNASSKKGST